MTLFEHDVAEGDDYLDSFEIRQGDRAAALAWVMCDGLPRKVRIYRSNDSCITDCEANARASQTLVYEGSGCRVRLEDLTHNEDVAYRYAAEIVYCYSLCARAGDGRWHLQLQVRAQPHCVGHWTHRCPTLPDRARAVAAASKRAQRDPGSKGIVGSRRP